MKPRVSVIIPVYNVEKIIGHCLKAMFNQSCSNDLYEVIVVDDGSTDGTERVVKNYPVIYIQQKNQGPAVSRNRGVQEAKGEIILFTDSDCTTDTNWINEMIKPFEDPKVMAVKGAYKNRQRSFMARFAQIEFEERFEMLRRVDSIDMVDTYSAGFRRETFLQMGGFDSSFPVANNEDTEFSYRMSKLGYRMVFHPHAIVYHLSHPDSIKKYVIQKFGRGYWRMIVYKRFPDKMFKDSYTPQSLKIQILFLYLSISILLLMGISGEYLPYLLPVLYASIIGFGIFAIPLTILALRLDPPIGMLCPFYILIRAASLGGGAILGSLSKGLRD